MITSCKALSQYYYTDIIALQQGRQLYTALKKNGIKLITATSTDDNGAPISDFKYERTLKDNAATSVTVTKLPNEL